MSETEQGGKSMSTFVRPIVNTPKLAADFIERELADGFLNPNVITPGSPADEALRVLIEAGRA